MAVRVEPFNVVVKAQRRVEGDQCVIRAQQDGRRPQAAAVQHRAPQPRPLAELGGAHRKAVLPNAAHTASNAAQKLAAAAVLHGGQLKRGHRIRRSRLFGAAPIQPPAHPAVDAAINQVCRTERHVEAPQQRLKWESEVQRHRHFRMLAHRVGQGVERQRGGLQLHGLQAGQVEIATAGIQSVADTGWPR
jgi:hypothetical protein